MDLTKLITKINKLVLSTLRKEKKVKMVVILSSYNIIKVKFQLFFKKYDEVISMAILSKSRITL